MATIVKTNLSRSSNLVTVPESMPPGAQVKNEGASQEGRKGWQGGAGKPRRMWSLRREAGGGWERRPPAWGISYKSVCQTVTMVRGRFRSGGGHKPLMSRSSNQMSGVPPVPPITPLYVTTLPKKVPLPWASHVPDV